MVGEISEPPGYLVFDVGTNAPSVADRRAGDFDNRWRTRNARDWPRLRRSAAHLFDCRFAAKSGDQRVGGGDLAVMAAARVIRRRLDFGRERIDQFRPRRAAVRILPQSPLARDTARKNGP